MLFLRDEKSNIDHVISRRDENFSNGRFIRNLYDNSVMNHARRVFNIKNPSKEDLCKIIDLDFKPRTS